jgi:hypothetical protein
MLLCNEIFALFLFLHVHVIKDFVTLQSADFREVRGLWSNGRGMVCKENIEQTPAPVPISLTWMLYEVTRDRTRDSGVRIQRLTAWAITITLTYPFGARDEVPRPFKTLNTIINPGI